MSEVLLYLGAILLLCGSSFTLLAAIGIIRLPDLYTRMHAASKAGSVGAGLVLIAVAIVCFEGAVALRAIMGVLFLLLTTPVSAHLLARASHRAGYKPNKITMLDEIETIKKSQSGS